MNYEPCELITYEGYDFDPLKVIAISPPTAAVSRINFKMYFEGGSVIEFICKPPDKESPTDAEMWKEAYRQRAILLSLVTSAKKIAYSRFQDHINT